MSEPRQRNEPRAESEHGAKLYDPTPGRPTYYRITWRTKSGEPKGCSAGRDLTTAVGRLGEIERMLKADLGDVGDQSFGTIIDEFLAYAEYNADSYQSQHKRNARLFIRPALGNVPAWDLSRTAVEKVLNSTSTVSDKKKLRVSMGALLTWAHGQATPRITQPRSHYIVEQPRNATRSGGRAQGKHKDFIPLRERPHPLACKALAEAMSAQFIGRRAEAAWLEVATASSCGPRESELWAFRKGDFDFDKHAVAVDRQVVHLDGGGFVECLPKGWKSRTTFIPERTIWGEPFEERLWEYLQKVPDVEGPELVEPPFDKVPKHRGRAPWLVFPTSQGCYWSASNWGTRQFNPAKRSLPLPTVAQPLGWRPGWKWHALRHAFASYMLSSDEATGKVAADPVDLSEWMGHESTYTTQAYVGSTQGQPDRGRNASAPAPKL